jgi:hypothetical protein
MNGVHRLFPLRLSRLPIEDSWQASDPRTEKTERRHRKHPARTLRAQRSRRAIVADSHRSARSLRKTPYAMKIGRKVAPTEPGTFAPAGPSPASLRPPDPPPPHPPPRADYAGGRRLLGGGMPWRLSRNPAPPFGSGAKRLDSFGATATGLRLEDSPSRARQTMGPAPGLLEDSSPLAWSGPIVCRARTFSMIEEDKDFGSKTRLRGGGSLRP